MSCRIVFGILMILFGGLFLLDNLHIIYFNFSDLWPAILIVVGLVMIVNSFRTGHGIRYNIEIGEKEQ